MTSGSCPSACPSRRAVLRSAGLAAAVGVGLTGCGSGQPAESSATAAPVASGTSLGAVADVPVGGGVVLLDAGIVLTQPAAGEIEAFSSQCTHAGCTVNQVRGGFIICPCHGSRFAIADGAPTPDSPAKRPLAARQITVSGGQITAA